MELQEKLSRLKLLWMARNAADVLRKAPDKKLSPADALAILVDGELQARSKKTAERRLRAAHVPIHKSLADFNWAWPESIDQDLVRELFRLDFIRNKGNAVFCGGVGLGKTHLLQALSVEACEKNHKVLFTLAIDMVNSLHAAATAGRLETALKRYVSPDFLAIDELGYLPIERTGSDLFFQVISKRHERSSTVITTNRAYKDWACTFANDAAITSAILDRLTERCSTVLITGSSYRMRDSRA
jgi:DNA replication protein DnaC